MIKAALTACLVVALTQLSFAETPAAPSAPLTDCAAKFSDWKNRTKCLQDNIGILQARLKSAVDELAAAKTDIAKAKQDAANARADVDRANSRINALQ